MRSTPRRTQRSIIGVMGLLAVVPSMLFARRSAAQPHLLAPLLYWPPDGSTEQPTDSSFSWSDVSGTDIRYRILVAPTHQALPTSPTAKECAGCVIDATVSTPSYAASPGVLRETTTYHWEVQAYNATVHGDWSAVSGFTTEVGDLQAPVLLAPPDGGTGESTTPTFRWSEVPHADLGYRIMVAPRTDALPMDPSATTCPGCVITATTHATSYTPAAGVLTDTANYYWEVEAQSSARPGKWSAIAGFSTAVVPGD